MLKNLLAWDWVCRKWSGRSSQCWWQSTRVFNASRQKSTRTNLLALPARKHLVGRWGFQQRIRRIQPARISRLWLFQFPSNGVYLLEVRYWNGSRTEKRFHLSDPIRLRLIHNLPPLPPTGGHKMLEQQMSASQSEPVFVTDTGQSTICDDGDLVVMPEVVERARSAPECRPADQNPEGNRGDARDGLRLSIRFATNEFTLAAPVTAKVILRNSGTNDMIIRSQWHIFDFLDKERTWAEVGVAPNPPPLRPPQHCRCLPDVRLRSPGISAPGST